MVSFSPYSQAYLRTIGSMTYNHPSRTCGPSNTCQHTVSRRGPISRGKNEGWRGLGRTYKFVEENVDVVRAQELHEVFPPDTLAPITASTAAEPVGQPEGLVIVSLSATRAAIVVAVLYSQKTPQVN